MLYEATIYNILWQPADGSADNTSSLQKWIYKILSQPTYVIPNDSLLHISVS